MKDLKGKVLVHGNTLVNENMLHQGIYETDKPNIHWEPDLTMEHEWPEQMYENIRECEFKDVTLAIDTRTLTNA